MGQRTEQKQMKARERPDCLWSQMPFYQHPGKDANFSFQQRSRTDNNKEKVSIFFLNTSNNCAKKEIWKTLPFTVSIHD